MFGLDNNLDPYICFFIIKVNGGIYSSRIISSHEMELKFFTNWKVAAENKNHTKNYEPYSIEPIASNLISFLNNKLKINH